ncbi:neuronal acetylcholine receptor subunit alpha-7-like [Antedon mediterranea]|uniref:neuronal acetylcholine receptor subunit alpha-7-like n=1 Tax=Antedon mediterranea TaxID=105859 RepID=UPI003AF6E6A7
MNLFQLLMLVILYLLYPVKQSLATNTESQLIRDLLDKYIEPSTRPVRDHTHNVTVTIRLLVSQVIEINEKRQEITVSGWFRMLWKDEFMVWDPNDYNNITEIFVEQSALWLPDVTLHNNVDGEFEQIKKSLHLRVNNDGMVHLGTPMIVKSFCKMYLKYFPFDEQKCALEFEPWIYHAKQQDLIPETGSESQQTEFNPNGAWSLKDVSVQYIPEKYNCCPEPFSKVVFTIILKRRERFFVEIILLPCCLLSILTMFVFLLPPESGEKMSFGVSTLLSILLFQQMISDALPPSADSTPILQIYFTMLTCMSCISIVCSAVLLNIYNCNQPEDIPKWLASILFGKVGKAIGRKTSAYYYNEQIFQKEMDTGNENMAYSNSDASVYSVKQSLATNTESQLIRDLLDKYIEPSTRPVRDHKNNVTVTIRLLVSQVIEINEKRQEITVSGWFKMLWKDEFMVWDPNDYNNITEIFVEQSALWLPDVTLYNNVDGEFEQIKRSLHLRVNNEGTVHLTTPMIVKSFCKMYLKYFPFDEQKCALEFAPWNYHIKQQDLIPETGSESQQTQFNPNGAWSLKDVSVQYITEKYNCCPEPFSKVVFTIILKRRERFFVEIILLPCCLLSILTMFVFLLPPESGEKMSFGVSTLLSILLFQQMISDALPPSADSTPILQIYFTMLTCMSCISIVCSAVLLNIYNRNQPEDIPKWLASILFGKVGKAIGRKTSAYYCNEHIFQKQMDTGNENTAYSNSDASVYSGRFISITQFDERIKYISDPAINSTPEELKLILNEMRLYSNEYKKEELNNFKKENWRNVAILVDRLLFIVLFIVVVIVTITVILLIISGK